MVNELAPWAALAVSLGILAGAVVAGLIAVAFLTTVLRFVLGRRPGYVAQTVARNVRRPLFLLIPLFALQVVTPAAGFGDETARLILHVAALLLIAAVAWFVISLTRAVVEIVDQRYDVAVADNLVARQIHTQVRVMMRVIAIVIVIIAVSAMLMTFPPVRQLGASLLASAGLAGLVVGFAARPVLENMIAGIQIALTQPIRIDDVVIIDGEWGQIEEIRATYVVVRIWDLRRLIVPLGFFVQNSFQNWTRTRADILGTVFIHVDYTVPVTAVREKLHEILEASGKWDGKGWALQVTGATERTVELRALMSAPDGPTAWELRCHVREKLIEWLQATYPDALPKVRGELATVASPQTTD
jgi:small-conductance mechanosensitive channel